MRSIRIAVLVVGLVLGATGWVMPASADGLDLGVVRVEQNGSCTRVVQIDGGAFACAEVGSSSAGASTGAASRFYDTDGFAGACLALDEPFDSAHPSCRAGEARARAYAFLPQRVPGSGPDEQVCIAGLRTSPALCQETLDQVNGLQYYPHVVLDSAYACFGQDWDERFTNGCVYDGFGWSDEQLHAGYGSSPGRGDFYGVYLADNHNATGRCRWYVLVGGVSFTPGCPAPVPAPIPLP